MGSVCDKCKYDSQQIVNEDHFIDSKDQVKVNNNQYNCVSTRQLTIRNEYQPKFISLNDSESEISKKAPQSEKKSHFSSFQTFQAQQSQTSKQFNPQFTFFPDDIILENQSIQLEK